MFLLKSRKNTRRRKNCLLLFNEKKVAITLLLQGQLVSLALALAASIPSRQSRGAGVQCIVAHIIHPQLFVKIS